MPDETGVRGATWVTKGGVGAVMVCTIDGLLEWCVMTVHKKVSMMDDADAVLDACKKLKEKFDGGIVVDEAHLVYGREKRRDLDAGQHVLPVEMVRDATDALGEKRLAVFGDGNQLDASELDVRGEEECMLVPSELPDRWLPTAKRRESIVAAWKDIRERRLHAEKLAWPVEMQVYPKGECVW